MHALVYEAPRTMVLRELDVPTPAPGEVLVRVAYSGICGSELSGYLGQSSLRQPPLVFGHEFTGHVCALGADVADGLAVGDRVAVNPLTACGQCPSCTSGQPQRCPDRRLLGAHLPGSNAEYVVTPSASVLTLPPHLDLRVAALAEPAACALHAAERTQVRAGDPALVVGVGPIGHLVVQALRMAGADPVFVYDRNAARCAAATRAGATPVLSVDQLSGLQVAVAVDAVGSTSSRESCVAASRPGAVIALVGLHADRSELPINTVVRNEVTLSGVFAYTPTHFQAGLSRLADGRMGLSDGLVTAPLSDGPRWYERLTSGDDTLKVLLEPAVTG